MHRREDLRVQERRALGIAGRGVHVQAPTVAHSERDLAPGNGPDAQLRPLQIQEHTDRPPDLLLDLADDAQPLGMVGVPAVAEVQPEHIGTGLEQRTDLRLARTGGP